MADTVFLFSILGKGVGSFELGKFMGKVEKLGKVLSRSMKSAIPMSKHSYLVVYVSWKIILTLFWDEKECFVYKFQSFFFKLSKLVIFAHQLGIKDTFLHWEWAEITRHDR